MREPSGGEAGAGTGPVLDLDQLLEQLIERAQDVRATRDRMRGLLQATQSIVGNLALEVVLRRIVEAACELLEARYGALGVLRADGLGLEQFIHVGIDETMVEAIGEMPQGKGVLGALIDDPAPIRLHELSNDERSVGFPDGHPPMHTFLGVPITIRGEVFGNLYLTERVNGDFTDEDVELASALAATAAVAIDNARLFGDARHRQEWLQASAEVSLQIATAAGDDPLRSVAEQVKRLARADVVTVVRPERGDRLAVAVAVGAGEAELAGASYPRTGTLSEQVLTTGEAAMLSGTTAQNDSLFLRGVVPVEHAMVLPLTGPDGVRGTLVVGRLSAGRPFTSSELDMAGTFANHAALALELAEARENQEQMQLYEERDRIARDLHDHVIQQLFAAGLTLQGVSMGISDPAHSARIEQVVDSLDGSIQQIRNSIFELRDHTGPQGRGVRAAILDVVAGVTPLLRFEPGVRFTGPVDTVVAGGLAEDVVAVVREALTNVARHAGASSAEVSLVASTDVVELRITDDGCGLGEPGRRSGLDNMSTRAQRWQGSFTTDAGADGTGTLLLWVVPALAERG